ncbi:MAG: HAD family hydrolase, partial [bacterium]
FKDVVGLSRQEVAQALLQHFHLAGAAQSRMADFQVQTPWQAFVQVRLQIYNKMLADSTILHEHVCPYNVGLLKYARGCGYKTGLATMSHCAQVNRVLQILRLNDEFDFIATRDDVEHGKPDPEIYNLVARQLQVRPKDCLVVEDSPTGVKAALAANMHCIVVTTDFTRKAIHASGLIEDRWIVDDPEKLVEVAGQKIEKC